LIRIAKGIEFKGVSRKEKYAWIEEVLGRFKYFSLKKKDKSIIKTYMMKMTGFSDAQITRLIAKKKKVGRILANTTKRHKFSSVYTPCDIALLVKTDNVHLRLSSPATKTILKRECTIFGKKGYERLKNISVSHIYNLRKKRQYTSHAQTYTNTQPVKTSIGERRKPSPEGKPGYIRVDTVHQGDKDKEKGVYHINMVDEVTQTEVTSAVEKISESYLIPILKEALKQFPFVIISFHSDNGSEYINKITASLLNKLLIKQTKSRSRHCNDNALVEGKNGAVIRKHMGRMFIPQKYATLINEFYRDHLNIYLNYHRPCGFATTITDKKGKERKVYKLNDYMTPYDKLKSLENVEQYLKKGITFKELDTIAYAQSDNECALDVKKAKVELFTHFKLEKLQLPTIFTYAVSGSSLD